MVDEDGAEVEMTLVSGSEVAITLYVELLLSFTLGDASALATFQAFFDTSDARKVIPPRMNHESVPC
jgi:hypothetical protein